MDFHHGALVSDRARKCRLNYAASPWRAASKRVSGGATRGAPSPDRGKARSSNPRLREINDGLQKEVPIL